MILYFSGTGNSRYVAKRIASVTGDELVNIGDRLRHQDHGGISGGDRLVFVLPTYAWRIPSFVRDWILRTYFTGGKAWFVMTCGSEIGNAAKYNQLLCRQKQFIYMGTAQILMPENYIAMFNAPPWKEAEQIIAAAEPDISKASEQIQAGKAFDAPRNHLYDRFMSSAVNPVFYKLFVKAGGFYAGDGCIGCGKCAADCPLGNIVIQNGKPNWGNDCTHCMACICGCPKEAIEYGKKSTGKPRYQCKLD